MRRDLYVLAWLMNPFSIAEPRQFSTCCRAILASSYLLFGVKMAVSSANVATIVLLFVKTSVVYKRYREIEREA